MKKYQINYNVKLSPPLLSEMSDLVEKFDLGINCLAMDRVMS